MQTFPRVQWGGLPRWRIGYIATVCATVLLHKSTQVCATKYLGDRMRVCWYSCSSCSSLPLCVCVCAAIFLLFYWVTSTQMRHPLPRFGAVSFSQDFHLCRDVNHLKIVFSFQLFIYCGTCSHSICQQPALKIQQRKVQQPQQIAAANSTSAFESFQNSFSAMRLENCNFRFEIL